MAGKGVRYAHMPVFFGAVPRLGVRMAMVGVCDASQETHGFWWKNGLTRYANHWDDVP